MQLKLFSTRLDLLSWGYTGPSSFRENSISAWKSSRMASFLYDPNGWRNLYGLHVGWPFCLRGLLVLCTPAASTDKPSPCFYRHHWPWTVLGAKSVWMLKGTKWWDPDAMLRVGFKTGCSPKWWWRVMRWLWGSLSSRGLHRTSVEILSCNVANTVHKYIHGSSSHTTKTAALGEMLLPGQDLGDTSHAERWKIIYTV